MKIQILGALAALAIAGSARAEPPPPALMPKAISGWSVMDLEAARAWYIDKLGMKQVGTYARDGKIIE